LIIIRNRKEGKRMKKKSKILVISSIIIIAVMIVGGILIYIFLKEKAQTPSDKDGESNETPGELPSTGEGTGIFSKIKNIFGGGGSGEGGGSGGGFGGGSGGSSSGEGGTSVSATSEITICQNAQNDNLCDGLDITYGEGYRTLCCLEHNLCC
jgi:hypothetical protein